MRNHDIWLCGLAWLGFASACAGNDTALSINDPNDGLIACTLDADCPSGLICQSAICVSPEDLLPPDIEDARVVGRPEASATRLFTLATDQDALLVLKPDDLSLQAVPVPAGPQALAVVPNTEAALVLSVAAQALTWVDMEGGPAVQSVRLQRRFSAISVSPDGTWAVLWTPDGVDPDDGAEGLVAFVNIQALSQGEVEPIEVAAGFRHTDVHFIVAGARTVSVVVLGKGLATVVQVADLGGEALLAQRILLPEAFADVVGREVVAAPGADILLMRSLATPALGILQVSSSTVAQIALPGRATDIDLSPTADRAVVAIRGTGQVALLPLPEVLSSTAAMEFIDIEGVSPGQVEVAADGLHAALFSGQDGSERFGWLDLLTGELVIFSQIEKEVRSIALTPNGQGAIILHRANPDSTAADAYERAVDKDEGYSLVDLSTGFTQLKRTGAAVPLEVSFGVSGRYAAISVLDEAGGQHRLESADLSTLIVRSFNLASSPRFLGALPGGERVWVTQVHPAGRISVLDMDSGRLQTLTGFQLNAEITTGGGQ